jgi:hypothetical protein
VEEEVEMDRHPVERTLKFGSDDDVRAIPHADLTEYLLGHLGEHAESWFAFDPDRLTGLGGRLARARCRDLDTSVLAWLEAEPGALRADVAAAFLAGFWSADVTESPPAGERVRSFMDLVNFVEAVPEGGRAYVITLVRAAQPSLDVQTKARIREELLRTLEDVEGTEHERSVRQIVDLGLRSLEGQ